MTLPPWLRLGLCRLRRHRPLLQLADGRIWLRCVECGYETPGITWRLPPAARSARVLRFKERLAREGDRQADHSGFRDRVNCGNRGETR